jgi:integrase
VARRRGHNEGSIYQTADGQWRGSVTVGHTPDGKQQRKYVRGRTRAEVSRKIATLVTDLQRGLPVASSSPTVGAFLDMWLEDVVRVKNRQRTYEAYGTIVRVHLTPALGKIKLEKLTAAQVQTMLNRAKANGARGRQLINIRAVLRAALNQAMRWDLVYRNVATLTDAPKPDDFQAKPLAAADVSTFLQAAKGDRLEALWMATVWLGLRQGEVFGIRWADLDLDAGSVRIQKQIQVTGKGETKQVQLVDTKTEKSRRTLPLPAPLVTSLRKHRKEQLTEQLLAGPRWKGGEWGLVFCTTIGTPLDQSNVTKRYRELLTAAGLEIRRFHDLRHSTGTYLAANGVHPRTIMEILGHSQISTTMNTYTHVELDSMRNALDSIGDLMGTDKATS